MAPVPSPYAIAKLAGEGYVRAFATLFGMKTLTLQYFNVFGPRQDPESPYSGVISRFATALLQGRSPTIHGDGRQSRDFTYVANVVDANRRGYGPLVDFETGCDTPSTGTSPCSDRYLLQEVRVAPAASPSGRPGASGALPDPYRFRRGTIRHSDIVTPWDLGITAISVAAFWHRMETTLAEAVSPPELAGPPASVLGDLWRSVGLWRVWTRLGIQDVRMRFRRSVLGAGWIFLNLAVLIAAIGYVYGHLLGQDLHEFIPFLTVGIVVWNYLTTSIVEGSNAFVGSEGYIKQISLPIYVYVFRFFVSIAVTFFINLAAFAFVAVGYRVPFGLGTLWAVPGIAVLMAASLALIIILAHVNARYRDAANLASIVMQVGFYVTPVIFPADLLRNRGLHYVVDLNPLYHLLEIVRQPLLHASPAPFSSIVGALLVVVCLSALAAALMARFGRRIVFAL